MINGSNILNRHRQKNVNVKKERVHGHTTISQPISHRCNSIYKKNDPTVNGSNAC